MTENIENIRIDEDILVLNNDDTLYEIDGVAYSLNELKTFIETSTELARKTERQTRFIKALKLNNSKLTLERNNAIDELNRIKALGMYEFANKYCTTKELEEAGHQLARSLGVGL